MRPRRGGKEEQQPGNQRQSVYLWWDGAAPAAASYGAMAVRRATRWLPPCLVVRSTRRWWQPPSSGRESFLLLSWRPSAPRNTSPRARGCARERLEQEQGLLAELPQLPEGTDEGDKRWRHFRGLSRNPGHRVISATPVKRQDGGCGVELGGKAARKSVLVQVRHDRPGFGFSPRRLGSWFSAPRLANSLLARTSGPARCLACFCIWHKHTSSLFSGVLQSPGP